MDGRAKCRSMVLAELVNLGFRASGEILWQKPKRTPETKKPTPTLVGAGSCSPADQSPTGCQVSGQAFYFATTRTISRHLFE